MSTRLFFQAGQPPRREEACLHQVLRQTRPDRIVGRQQLPSAVVSDRHPILVLSDRPEIFGADLHKYRTSASAGCHRFADLLSINLSHQPEGKARSGTTQ